MSKLGALSKARRLDYWGELAAAVKRHPGWRLDLIVRNDDNKDMSPISLEDIEARLQDGASLAESKKLDAALLITWSAFEAAAMQAAKQQDVRLSHKSVAALISTLYTEGLIDREDYDLLMRCMQVRNQIAHGVQSSPVDSSCVQEIERVARELLDQDLLMLGVRRKGKTTAKRTKLRNDNYYAPRPLLPALQRQLAPCSSRIPLHNHLRPPCSVHIYVVPHVLISVLDCWQRQAR